MTTPLLAPLAITPPALAPAGPIEPGALRTPAAVLAAARQLGAAGRDIVHLEVGEPDFPTPAHIIEAGIRALRHGHTRYVEAAGLPELRQAIAERVTARGAAASAGQVVVAAGARPMLHYVLRAVLRVGERVLVPDPGYPGYAAAARLVGAHADHYPVLAERDGRLRVDLEALEALVGPRTRALVLNSPHNPTGAMLDDAELGRLADFAVRHELQVISDEVYGALVHDGGVAPSIACLPELRDRTVVVDSFSKTYAMTGWRLGYAVAPARLAPALVGIAAESSTCVPPFVQQAGVAALRGPQGAVEEMRLAYRARRDAALDAMQAIPGLTTSSPRGAFYLLVELAGLLGTAAGSARVTGPSTPACARLVERLLLEHGLAAVPGCAFGRRGEGRLRLAVVASPERLREGIRRLAACVAALRLEAAGVAAGSEG